MYSYILSELGKVCGLFEFSKKKLFFYIFLLLQSNEDELKNKKFPNGRHRDKTYLDVFQNDKEFCQMVLNGEQSSFIPEDFRDFLLTRPKGIKGQVRVCSLFLEGLPCEIRQILKNIIGDIKVAVKEVHPPCCKVSNGFVGEFYDMDEENLQHVKEYLQHFPNISTAVVNYEVKTDFLESTALISTEDTCLEARVSKKKRTNVKYFYELILHGALSPKNIKRLVIYNAFYGVESSIAMPENKEALIDFIRTYNRCDFSKPPPPEKFITQEREKYFKGDVANWDSRRVYNAF